MFKTYCLFLFTLLLCSCGVRYKSIPYFVDLPNTNVTERIENEKVLTIQKEDILAITVSSLSPEASGIFNLTSGMGGGTAAAAASGFPVDQDGNLYLPYLGAVQVEGLTTKAARNLIQNKLNEGNYLKNAIVSLRLANFKISVLGDVGRPGVFPIASERVTVIEAISMAGDLNITGKRNDVLLIRENLGKRQHIRLNLQEKAIFDSPYYYLENNDVLVITPSVAKYDSIDSRYRNASLIFSAISIIIFVISSIK